VETEPTTSPLPPEGALTVAPAEGAEALILHDPAALAAQLKSYGEARKLLVDWLMAQLVAGIDYTLIHKKIGPRGNKQDCPNKGNMVERSCAACGGKSTLCKPGSEKLCGLLRLRPVFSRDADTWEMLGSEPGVVSLKCELVTAGGTVVAEGRGARHRDQDFGDLNKTVKMVQKSAQTDAVLRCAGLSEIFTQDLEDLPGGYTDSADEAGDFQTPKAKAAATPAPAVPAETLQSQLRRSVEAASSARAERGPAAPRAAQAPTRPTRPVPAPARGQAPSDALSPARVNRLMALLHEALRAAEVPQEEHEAVFDVARTYLVEWVGRTQGRERLSDCSWRAYDELCAQVPAAVDAALGAEGPPPAPRARPQLVRRSYGAPKPFARRGY
jgi:hypothetical protein